MPAWNLENIYCFKDTEKLVAELKKEVAEFTKFRSQLSKDLSPAEFMNILKKKEQITILSSKLDGYAHLWLAENTADPKRTAHEAKIAEVVAEAGNEVMFFSLWFKKLEDKAAKKFIDASGPYHYLLKRWRSFKDFTLPEKEEQIITLKDLTGCQAAIKFYDIITNKFRYEWEGKKVSQSELGPMKMSPKREVRKKAYDLLFERYAQEEEVLSEIYRTIVNDWRNENMKIRKFKSPIAVRNLANDIPDKVTTTLLKVVKKNNKLFQEYFTLKAKLCKIKNMDRYDLYIPFSAKENKYPYEESKKIVLDAYKNFDEKAHQMVKKIFDEGHVHSELTENKQSGAFCCTVLNNITPYVLLNHVDRLRDVFTMMHEMGHGMHGVAAQHQTAFTYHSALPLAETASIFGELILAKQLLSRLTKDEKIATLMHLLDDQYAGITRQAYFVLFENAAHDAIAKGATVDELNKIYKEHLDEQFGDALTVPEIFKHEWKYIPHIYHVPFYCYAYVFGNLLVLALYKKFETEGRSFIPKYLKILSYGGSEAPQKILEEVGVDITKESFWQQGFDIIQEELEELKKLTN